MSCKSAAETRLSGIRHINYAPGPFPTGNWRSDKMAKCARTPPLLERAHAYNRRSTEGGALPFTVV